MGLVAYFEDVVSGNETEPRVRRLKVVDCLSHVTFGRKDESSQAVVVVLDLSSPSV